MAIPTPALISSKLLQLGLEATCGEAVVPTDIWVGPWATGDGTVVENPKYFTGSQFQQTQSTYISSQTATVEWSETPLTSEQLPIIFNSTIKKALAVADGVADGWIRTYSFDELNNMDISTYIVRAGDAEEVYEATYCFGVGFTITGAGETALQLSGSSLARHWEGGKTFAALTAPPVFSVFRFSGGRVWIDDVASGFGTTLVSNSVIGMSLDLSALNKAVFSADGLDGDFTFAKRLETPITLTLTLEQDAVAVVERQNKVDAKPRAVRLEFLGRELAVSGVYTHHTLIIEAAGTWGASTVGAEDNNVTQEFVLNVQYDPTLGTEGQIILVNETAGAGILP